MSGACKISIVDIDIRHVATSSPTQIGLCSVIPNEIIYMITRFMTSGYGRVYSACYRMVCKVFAQFITPVRSRYVILNLSPLTDTMCRELLIAYRYDIQLQMAILSKKLKKIRTQNNGLNV